VTGDDARPARRQVTFGEMEVGTAHAAHRDAYEDLAATRLRVTALAAAQRPAGDRPGFFDPPRPHHHLPSECFRAIGVLRVG
jgi:hypothetical protein